MNIEIMVKRKKISFIARDAKTHFAIRVLSERTGVGTSTLRAWERRYGLLTPERTPKGHRLYSEKDVKLVEHILVLLEEGHSLSAIARQIKQGLASVEDDDRENQAGVWAHYLADNLQAIYDFSTERVEAIYNEASSLYPVDMVTERLIEPTLTELGNNWQLRERGIGEEHFYASWVRNRLGARFHHAYSQATGARILLACVPGSHHELGLMLFAISALTRGYRVLYLGADLPLDQVSSVVAQSGSRAVVLATRSDLDDATQSQLAKLSTSLEVPVMLGGMGSDRALPAFEAVGGIRLGSRISIALRVLAAHIPAFSTSERSISRSVS